MKLRKILVLAITAIISVQVLLVGAASAQGVSTQEGASDLSIAIVPTAAERGFAAVFCNAGTDTLTEVVLDIDTTTMTIREVLALPSGFAGTNATSTLGFDALTGIWEGELEQSQCAALGILIAPNVAVGQTMQLDVAIIGSTTDLNEENIDSNSSNDSASYTTGPVVLDPDLIIESRLLTEGEITNGSTVSYEITISNIGQGNYIEDISQPIGMYFVLPTGATLDEVVDLNTNDILGLDDPQTDCGSFPIPLEQFPGLASYSGDIAGCAFDLDGGTIPPGATFKFEVKFITAGSYIPGTSKVLATIFGNDADSLFFQAAAGIGIDPGTLDVNNIIYLVYDDGDLTPTINRCPGTNQVTYINDACFKINFNKEIYGDSFTIDDLVLNGGGNIYSFTQTAPNEWTVRINDLPAGKLVSLSIAKGGVIDLSAVSNGVSVLGENAVRFEVEAQDSTNNQVQGELPATGSNTDLTIYALLLIAIGLVLEARKSLFQKMVILATRR